MQHTKHKDISSDAISRHHVCSSPLLPLKLPAPVSRGTCNSYILESSVEEISEVYWTWCEHLDGKRDGSTIALSLLFKSGHPGTGINIDCSSPRRTDRYLFSRLPCSAFLQTFQKLTRDEMPRNRSLFIIRRASCCRPATSSICPKS